MVCNRNDAVRHFYAHKTYFYRLLLASISNNRSSNFRRFTVCVVCFFTECAEPTVRNAVFYGSRKFGEYNNITCNDGYEGSADITCTADKIWDRLPTCSPVGKFQEMRV